MKWLNEPPEWRELAQGLIVHTRSETDFWRVTHDGGVRDSGHFYYRTISGDFEARFDHFTLAHEL